MFKLFCEILKKYHNFVSHKVSQTILFSIQNPVFESITLIWTDLTSVLEEVMWSFYTQLEINTP